MAENFSEMLDLTLSIPDKLFASRINPDNASLIYNGKPQVTVINKNDGTYDLSIVFNFTPEHIGPKKIPVGVDEGFILCGEGDIYKNTVDPLLTFKGVTGGFSQMEISLPIVTKATKVEHGQ